MRNIMLVYIITGVLWAVYALDIRRRSRRSARDGVFDSVLNNMLLWPFGLTISAVAGMLRDDMRALAASASRTLHLIRR